MCGGNVVDSGSMTKTFVNGAVAPTTTTTTTTTPKPKPTPTNSFPPSLIPIIRGKESLNFNYKTLRIKPANVFDLTLFF